MQITGVFARTGEAGERTGITCFIADGGSPGMTTRPIKTIRYCSPYELTFDGVKVPVENRISEGGQGFAICAAGTLGIAEAAMQIAIDWAQERQAFKPKLVDKQAIQWELADSEIELRAAKLLVYQAAYVDCQGFATETAGRIYQSLRASPRRNWRHCRAASSGGMVPGTTHQAHRRRSVRSSTHGRRSQPDKQKMRFACL
jgi:alkylation response protein AidB-like acyl-CoA dehydrogenase